MFNLLEHTCSSCFFLFIDILIIYYFHYTFNSENEVVHSIRVLHLLGINVITGEKRNKLPTNVFVSNLISNAIETISSTQMKLKICLAHFDSI